MKIEQTQAIIEAALMAAGKPLSMANLQNLFQEEDRPSTSEIKVLLQSIKDRHQDSGIELKEVGSGYRLQTRASLNPWLSKLWEERPSRYSRAFMETLAIIAYKQPVTRAEIESIRGVSVSSHIMKALLEREWIRIIGHREVPGKPAIYGSTKQFLDHFSLKSITELPALIEFQSFENNPQLQEELHFAENEPSEVLSEFPEMQTASGEA